MFDCYHYVPILKGKAAEFWAIQNLRDKSRITPVIEAIPSKPATIIPESMDRAWDVSLPYFIDLIYFDDDRPEPSSWPEQQFIDCFSLAHNMNQNVIPVTGLSRSRQYQESIRTVVLTDDHGVAVRIIPDDLEDERYLQAGLEGLQSFLGIGPGSIDIILDYSRVYEQNPSTIAQILRAGIQIFPEVERWRTFSVVSGAFPTGLGQLKRGTWNLIPRVDWLAWRRLISSPHKLPRTPAYGDYCIYNPSLPPESRATILAQLRYSTSEHFMVWKGHDAHKHEEGFGQFFSICEDLVGRPEYSGAEFSAGDAEIAVRSTTRSSPGNAQSWLKFGSSHHLETVISQLASLSEL
jgi:hypothetical protein